MDYFLSKSCALKRLESPCVYNMATDDLYELDEDSFEFLKNCTAGSGSFPQDKEFIDYCMAEGILSNEPNSSGMTLLTDSPKPSLRYLELQITDKCNLTCGHCYINDKASNELPLHIVSDILTEFEQLQGLRLLITGGEPLLHSQFNGINIMLPDFHVRKILFTNGLLLKDKTLKGLNVDEIQISIDGLERAHDSLRGKGTFRQAVRAVERAIGFGFDVSVSTMIHPDNLNDFAAMEKIFKEIGIKDWSVDIPCATGSLCKNAGCQISPEEGGKYLKYGFGGGLHSTGTGFSCGLHLMSVMADGKVAKCTFYADQSAGSVSEGLRTCWSRIQTPRLSDLACDCEHIEECRGGCRYRAGLLGDPFGKDLFRCSLYNVLS